MAKRKAMIDYQECFPMKCNKGICVTTASCPHKIFIQEEAYEVPYILQDFCTGCGKCVAACPWKAVQML